MSPLDALICASIATGLPLVGATPDWQARTPTARECAWTSIHSGCEGMYLPFGNGVLIAERWPVLVHEACHALQRANGVPFDEAQCYRAQARAVTCQEAPHPPQVTLLREPK
jgi:hypothetical protein